MISSIKINTRHFSFLTTSNLSAEAVLPPLSMQLHVLPELLYHFLSFGCLENCTAF